MQHAMSYASHGSTVDHTRIIHCAVLSVWLVLLASCATVRSDPPNAFAARSYIENSQQLYEVQPDIPACNAGMLADSVRERVLQLVNRIRGIHGLSPVTYNREFEPEVMETSLMMAANGQLSHDPPSSWKCYTDKGANGAKHSNLHGGMMSRYLQFLTPEQIVTGWLTDVRNASGDNVGHRRWLLDPFLQNISFGLVSGRVGSAMTSGAAIRVIWERPGPPQAQQSSNEFIAYPINDYPSELFDRNAIISFTALVNPRSKYDNAADYSKATVRVTDEKGEKQTVRDITSDSQGFGIPNIIKFRLPDMQYNKRYNIHITNVLVGNKGTAAPKDYSYWFRIL